MNYIKTKSIIQSNIFFPIIPPQAKRWIWANAKLGTKKLKKWLRQAFGEDVGELKIGRNKLSNELFGENYLANKVVININMLRTLVSNRIMGKKYSTFVITRKSRGSRVNMQIAPQMSEPH